MAVQQVLVHYVQPPFLLYLRRGRTASQWLIVRGRAGGRGGGVFRGGGRIVRAAVRAQVVARLLLPGLAAASAFLRLVGGGEKAAGQLGKLLLLWLLRGLLLLLLLLEQLANNSPAELSGGNDGGLAGFVGHDQWRHNVDHPARGGLTHKRPEKEDPIVS